MGVILARVVRASRWLAQLVHPHRCLLCRGALPVGTPAMLCPGCARRVRQEYRNTEMITIPGAAGADAPLLYVGQLANAMKRYKFYRSTALSRWFSAQGAACLASHLDEWQPDCLTYVPLGLICWWPRGFNQSEVLARQIGKALHLPVCAALGKRPRIGKQSRRTARERWKAARNMFFPLPGGAVRGKRVVLIDDIITTGASAADGVRALRKAGAAEVFVLAPLSTPWDAHKYREPLNKSPNASSRHKLPVDGVRKP